MAEVKIASPSLSTILLARTHYECLGISVDASFADIRAKFRQVALICHPDKNDDPQAGPAFIKVSEAFSVLKDADSRAAYDRTLKTTPAFGRRASGKRTTATAATEAT